MRILCTTATILIMLKKGYSLHLKLSPSFFKPLSSLKLCFWWSKELGQKVTENTMLTLAHLFLKRKHLYSHICHNKDKKKIFYHGYYFFCFCSQVTHSHWKMALTWWGNSKTWKNKKAALICNSPLLIVVVINNFCICHSGDPDSGESPIALVKIPIMISPSGNTDLLWKSCSHY